MKKSLLSILVLSLAPNMPAQSPDCDLSAPGSRDPAWSPDGTSIVFSSDRTGTNEIYLMSLHESEHRLSPVQLTNGEVANYYPFISPDGTRITFLSWGDDRGAIHVMDLDGGNLHTISGEDGLYADPSWSPDGSQIIYYTDRDGNDEVYVMDANGQNQRRLTENEARDQTPSLSPDGSRIVFVSTRDGNADIFVMDSEGGGQTNLTRHPWNDRVPSWSPDGRQIAWYARAPSSDSTVGLTGWPSAEIFVMDADGSNRRQLTKNSVPDHGPVFSPDGTQIAFTSCRTGRREVFVMQVDGLEVRQMTFTEELGR